MSQTLVDLSQVRVIDELNTWEYLAEGNASLVIRLINEQSVLRLFKTMHLGSSNENDLTDKVLETYLFVNNIIMPLLSDMKNIVKTAELVKVTKSVITDITRKLTSTRPGNRQHKELLIQDSFAYLLPDCTSIPRHMNGTTKPSNVFCVEIKLKQGNPLIYNNKLLCHFCLLQHLKCFESKLEMRSEYCPIKLFSGCNNCMHDSLSGLLKTPQNNLRIFKDGKVIFGDDKDGINEVLQSLFGPLDCTDNPKDKFIKIMSQVLMKSLGNDMSYPIYYRYQPQPLLPCGGKRHKHQCYLNPLPPTSILGRIKSLQELPLSNIDSLEAQCRDASEFLKENPFTVKPWREAVTILQRTIIALTMKDCSVMITMMPLISTSKSSETSEECPGVSVLDVTCVDLDYKPPQRIVKLIDQIKRGYKLIIH